MKSKNIGVKFTALIACRNSTFYHCIMKVFIARAALVLLSLILLVQLWIFSSLVWWKYQPVERSMFMRIYEWSYNQPAIRHEWKDSSRISNNLKRALIAGEDARFVDHAGFDWDGIEL